LVYRSYDSTTPAVAYYRFHNLRSSPVDSTFFRGYDYGSLALDSLEGKYLVLVGQGGKVCLTKRDIVLGVENTQPSIPPPFILQQNYPNPFNPSTTISFSVGRQAFVSLRVFDLLGSEVASLVNEKKDVGKYEVVFDALNLSSGVYFYRLSVGDFLKTNKMVVLH
jgi:hypothetical protein